MFGNEDITFCFYADCKHTLCFRHQSHLVNPQYPHSVADFTKDCSYLKTLPERNLLVSQTEERWNELLERYKEGSDEDSD